MKIYPVDKQKHNAFEFEYEGKVVRKKNYDSWSTGYPIIGDLVEVRGQNDYKVLRVLMVKEYDEKKDTITLINTQDQSIMKFSTNPSFEPYNWRYNLRLISRANNK